MMAGGRPAVVRAAIVAAVYLLAVPLEREPDLFNALAVAALFLLAQNPFCVLEAGFQLTFLTVITIALLMPCAERGLKQARSAIRGEWPGAKTARAAAYGCASCFALAFAAQAGAAPLVAFYYNSFSPLSLLANLLIVPLLGAVLATGFLAACMASIAPALAAPLYGALGPLLDWIAVSVRWCAHLPYSTLSVSSPPLLLIVIYYAGLWSLARYLRRRDSGADVESLSWEEPSKMEIEHV